MKEDEVGGAYVTRWREEKCVQNFGGESKKERFNLEHIGVDWDVISKGILNKWYGVYSEELILFNIETSSEMLGPKWWHFGFYKIRGFSC